jgi:putative hydrolase of the HAD superfamily
MHMIRAVFFDAVGTLITPDPPVARAYADVGRRFGSRLGPPEVAARIGPAFRRQEELDWADDLRTDEERERRRWRTIVSEAINDIRDPEACFQTLWDHFARPEAWRVEPEAAPLLAELARRGLILGLASNFDRRLRALAAALPGLAPLSEVVVSSEVGWRKPAGAFFEELCRRTGLRGQEILVVGDDRLNDYKGAQDAGLSAMLFDPRGDSSGPDWLARLADLPRLLD